jgi:hypothetical protein
MTITWLSMISRLMAPGSGRSSARATGVCKRASNQSAVCACGGMVVPLEISAPVGVVAACQNSDPEHTVAARLKQSPVPLRQPQLLLRFAVVRGF